MPENMVFVEQRAGLLQLLDDAGATTRLHALNFFTEDCYVCRSLFPKIKKIAAQNPDITFVEVSFHVSFFAAQGFTGALDLVRCFPPKSVCVSLARDMPHICSLV